MQYYYVYILSSLSCGGKHYVGITTDLNSRLRAHNAGQSPYSSKHRPWQLDTAIAFRSRERAAAFEQYLKSHAGRAFASKHL